MAISGQVRIASATPVPVRMPCRLASLLAARQQVVVAMTGMTATGLPRR